MRETLLKGLLLLFVLAAVLVVGVAAQAQTAQEDAYIQAVKQAQLAIVVNAKEVNDAWERAKIFIARYGDTRSSIISDYIIDTNAAFTSYGASQAECKYAYSILKIKEYDGTYRIVVECNCIKGGATSTAKNNAKILSYYIKTGKLMPRFINAL